MLKLFFAVNHSGCAWWRSRQPAEMIKKLGLAEVMVYSQSESIRSGIMDAVDKADVIVSQSPGGVDAIALTVQYQKMGKVVVTDYDDLVYSCSPFNDAYKTLGLQEVMVKTKDGKEQYLWKDGEKGFSIKDNYCRFRSQQDLFNIVDGVSVTTHYLKDAYIAENPEVEDKIEVLPNSIDFDLFKPFAKKPTDRIRIGWIASSSHLNEIWMVRNILEKIFKKYGEQVVFVELSDIIELKKVFKEGMVEFHPFTDLSMYPLKVASLNLDIGICPLVDDEFNRHKSQLKWSEYASFNVPSVCSDLPPYNCVEDGKTGYLAKTEDDFVEKLSLLIENEKLRREIAQNAFDMNYENFNLKKNVHKWVDFYEMCHSRVWVNR